MKRPQPGEQAGAECEEGEPAPGEPGCGKIDDNKKSETKAWPRGEGEAGSWGPLTR